MKRLHINLSVSDLNQSVEFYTQLFAAEPTKLKVDYAKWMLDDPRVNFSLTTHGGEVGIDHLGLQVDNDAEFEEMRMRLNNAQGPVLDQPDVTCCYARSTKAWVRDPSGIPWETFISRGDSVEFGDGSETRAHGAAEPTAACCR